MKPGMAPMTYRNEDNALQQLRTGHEAPKVTKIEGARRNGIDTF